MKNVSENLFISSPFWRTNNTLYIYKILLIMSDDEAVDAVHRLPHEMYERLGSVTGGGLRFNIVSDAHKNTSSSSSGGDDINPVVETSVQPRANQISSSTTNSSEEYQCIEYTRDGSLFASIVTSSSSAMCENDEDESGGQNTSKTNKTSKTNVVLFDGETNAEVTRISEQFVQGASCVAFSNTGKFLSIYRKGANHAGGTKEKNLSVWEIPSKENDEPKKVFECFQKTFVKQEWPYLQFSKDDKVCARCVTNEIQFYDAEKFEEEKEEEETSSLARYRIPGVALARLSMSETKPTVGVFVPESKGIPGSVRIYEVPDVKKEKGVSEPNAVARKSFFRISEVDLKWSPDGSALLVCGYCEVDASNKNYYGESSLHFLKADGSLDCKVDLSKEGPVHDAQWSPTSENFAVCYGFMPAKCTIFDAKKCVATYELGAGPHNTIRWNPFGRFIMLAGFGNLPGDVKFYHRLFDGKFKLMGSCRAACSVTAEWSPCGRRLLTSTVAPRLNVDNGFKIWRYNGELLAHVEREKLYEAAWRPRKEGAYPSLGISKNSKRVEGGSASGSVNAIPEKPAAFVPPHLRNKSGGSSTSGMGSRSNSGGNFSLATVSAEEARAGKVKAAVDNIAKKQQQSQQKRVIPGAEPVVNETAAQKKNRKKAEARRAKKLAEEMEAKNKV